MSTEKRTRLIDAGWSLTCERYIEIDIRGDNKAEQRFCTWRATKGTDEVVVKAKLGADQIAMLNLYNAAKALDPDLQEMAVEAGSGAWIIDLSKVESKHELDD